MYFKTSVLNFAENDFLVGAISVERFSNNHHDVEIEKSRKHNSAYFRGRLISLNSFLICGRLTFKSAYFRMSAYYRRNTVYKLRLFTDKMNDNYNKMYNVSENVSIYESKVLFKGRNSLKQYNPMKSIKRGRVQNLDACRSIKGKS